MQKRAVWANRYAIFDEIASGNMATVYAAGRLGQVNRRRVVAVKKLAPQFANESEFVAMFLDEARLSARVHHENVVETFQVLRVPGSLAIVMEMIVGVSLVELLRSCHEQKTAPPPRVAARILAGALRGLHAAHEAKDETGRPFDLVHRDVSPHNILVGKDGVARVIDFGVAKASGRLQVTAAGVTRGNCAYMSPEQLRGETIDRRTDVYAAGVVLWELLTGHRLFQGIIDGMALGERAAGTKEIAAPSSIDAQLSPRVDALVLRSLSDQPARRYPSAEEMAAEIESEIGAATLEEVGEWVDTVASARLREIEGKIRIVEEAFDRGELEEAIATASDRLGQPAKIHATAVSAIAEGDVRMPASLRVAPELLLAQASRVDDEPPLLEDDFIIEEEVGLELELPPPPSAALTVPAPAGVLTVPAPAEASVLTVPAPALAPPEPAPAPRPPPAAVALPPVRPKPRAVRTLPPKSGPRRLAPAAKTVRKKKKPHPSTLVLPAVIGALLAVLVVCVWALASRM